MALTPAGPSPSNRSEIGRRERQGEGEQPRAGATETSERSQSEQAEREVYGVLAIERHVKDDGRALILYSRPAGAGSRVDAGAQADAGLERGLGRAGR